MAGVPVAYDIKFKDLIKEMQEAFGPQLIKANHDLMKDYTHDYARLVTKRAKDIIAEGTDGSGQLAASLGYYEPGYLSAHYSERFATANGNAHSSAADAVWEEYESRGQFIVNIGSTVPYGEAAMYGFTRPGDGRVVYIPKYGRFVRLNTPFDWPGLHAVERAMDEVNAGSEGQKLYNQYFQRLQRRAR